jgi:hypothetical protein
VSEPKPVRDYQPRESRLLAEWLAKTYPDGGYRTHVRLGPPVTNTLGEFASAEELNLIGAAFRRWADAVVMLPDVLAVVEAKMVLKPDVIGQLELYLELVGKTPELAAWSDRPNQGWIVCGVSDPATATMAARRGYRVIVYRPPWFDEWLLVLRRRETRAPTQVVYGNNSDEGSE